MLSTGPPLPGAASGRRAAAEGLGWLRRALPLAQSWPLWARRPWTCPDVVEHVWSNRSKAVLVERFQVHTAGGWGL